MAYCQDYYWYKGNKLPLKRGNQHYILYQEKGIKSYSSQITEVEETIYYQDKTLKAGIITQLSDIDETNILYRIPSYLTQDSTKNLYITHRFCVKLKSSNDFTVLQDFVRQYDAEIEQEGDFPLWYIVRCGLNSQYNALELANIFYESNLFAVCEPELIGIVNYDCVNDSKFGDQWNLKNTRQGYFWESGIDINYCEANAITTGDSSVIIGVYDLGVDRTHPDINLYPFSYDVNTKSSPSTIYTTDNGNNYHGTACAGIIGAKTNNNLGVAGIAPNCPIMSLSFYNASSCRIGRGFKVAADSGCSVISNSWNLSDSSNYVNEGISYALSEGRNGKGCVIVFSAGNENRDSVNYPARSNDSIIVVGAISPCGERCNPYSCDAENWGSNYGDKLDIMAPGVKIRTTDNVGTGGKTATDYMDDFNGTSSACPHVAAVAGLILSVNPFLTQKEVVDIIESTARKIGTGYNPKPSRPNGDWSYYFGYGLVDAYAAVVEAQNRLPKIQGSDYICIDDTINFSLLDIPEDVLSYSWTTTTGLVFLGTLDIVQGQGSPSIRVVSQKREVLPPAYPKIGNIPSIVPPIDANMYVSVTITMSDSTTYTVKKRLHGARGATPIIEESSTERPWCSGEMRYFAITNNTDAPVDSLQWEIVDVVFKPTGNDTIITRGIGDGIYYTPYVQPTYLGTVKITATNTFETCGEEQSTTLTIGTYNPSLSLVATNDGNVLNISIVENNEKQLALVQLDERSSYILEIWHSIEGCVHTQSMLSNNEQINITGFQQGTYILLLKENGNIIAQTKVIIN